MSISEWDMLPIVLDDSSGKHSHQGTREWIKGASREIATLSTDLAALLKLVGNYQQATIASTQNLSAERHFGLTMVQLFTRKALFDAYNAREK